MTKKGREAMRDSEGARYVDKSTYQLKMMLAKLLYMMNGTDEVNEREIYKEKISAICGILFHRKLEVILPKFRPDPFISNGFNAATESDELADDTAKQNGVFS